MDRCLIHLSMMNHIKIHKNAVRDKRERLTKNKYRNSNVKPLEYK